MRLVSGVLVLIPLAITLFVVKLILTSLTGFVLPVLRPWLGERVEEYNQLLRTEEDLGRPAQYAGKNAFVRPVRF